MNIAAWIIVSIAVLFIAWIAYEAKRAPDSSSDEWHKEAVDFRTMDKSKISD